MNLYIHTSGKLERDNNSLVYRTTDNKKINIPIKTTKALFLFGQTDFNTQTLWILAKERIPCHIFGWNGNHVSTITPHPQQISGTLAIKQSQAFKSKEKRMNICRSFIDAASHNILSNCKKNNLPCQTQIQLLREKIKTTQSPEELMGIEGNIRKLYYQSWQPWLGLCSPFLRQYNPPTNPINAILSFTNSLIYATAVSELYRTALHPSIAYLHEPQSRRYSLALDITEITKPTIVDRFIAKIWNNKEIKDSDFEAHSNGIFLKEEARKIIVKKWDEMINRSSYSKELKRNISYRGIIRRDCYKLIRYLLDNEPLSFYKIDY